MKTMGEEVNYKEDKSHKKIAFLIWTIIGIIGLLAFGIATTTISENSISTSGNGTFLDSLGIGTSTPSQTLDVRGQGNFSSILYYNNATSITSLNDTILILNINSTLDAKIVIVNNTVYFVNSSLTGQIISVNNSVVLINNTLDGRITSVNNSFLSANTTLWSRINSINSSALSINTTANIQNILNNTGIYSIPLTINTTLNIQNLYNLTASMIANLSISQSAFYYNHTLSTFNTYNSTWDNRGLISANNLSMFNYVNANNLSNFNYVNTVASSLNTTANIWNLITGIFTNVAFFNQTNVFSANQNFSKNITLSGGSINLNSNATITNENGRGTKIFLDENGNIDITLG